MFTLFDDGTYLLGNIIAIAAGPKFAGVGAVVSVFKCLLLVLALHIAVVIQTYDWDMKILSPSFYNVASTMYIGCIGLDGLHGGDEDDLSLWAKTEKLKAAVVNDTLQALKAELCRFEGMWTFVLKPNIVGAGCYEDEAGFYLAPLVYGLLQSAYLIHDDVIVAQGADVFLSVSLGIGGMRPCGSTSGVTATTAWFQRLFEPCVPTFRL